MSYDDYKQGDLHEQTLTPKAGVQWNVTDNLRLRAAAFRTIKPAVIATKPSSPLRFPDLTNSSMITMELHRCITVWESTPACSRSFTQG